MYLHVRKEGVVQVISPDPIEKEQKNVGE